MSTQSQPYRNWSETDWYDHVEDRDRADSDDDGHHQERAGTDRLEWVAHDILKSSARLLCATTLWDAPDRGWSPHMAAEGVPDAPDHDPDAMHHERGEVELTEPRVALGKTADGWGTHAYGYSGHDKRVQPETGYLSGGESTGVVIADRPTEEFLAVVDLVVACRDLRRKTAEHVRAFAREQKAEGNARDVDILRDVLARIEAAEKGVN
jgi:hypothetical protein